MIRLERLLSLLGLQTWCMLALLTPERIGHPEQRTVEHDASIPRSRPS